MRGRGFGFALVVVVASAPARADCPETQEQGEAFELFQQGRALIDAGKPDEACAKFELSIRKDPRAVGTLLNLGLCNEQRGKTATALRLYREALDRATEANLTTEASAAQAKLVALSPLVPIVTLSYAVPPTTETKLVVDNAVVPPATHELPVDPGRHELAMSAPGRLPYEASFEVGRGDHRTLALPALALPGTRIVEQPAGPRFYGKLALYTGLGLVAAGGGLALWEWHRYDAQFPGNCGGDRPPVDGRPACNAAGRAATDRARTYGNVASVVVGIGIAAAITGGIVVWRSPHRERRATIVPTASADQVGAMLIGDF
jgi:Tetratricopeptide repeat